MQFEGIPDADEESENKEDFIRAIITNEEDINDAIGQLRRVYPNVMRIDFDNSRSRIVVDSKTAASGDVARKSPMELFSEFFINQNNIEMTNEQQSEMKDVIELAGGVDR